MKLWDALKFIRFLGNKLKKSETKLQFLWLVGRVIFPTLVTKIYLSTTLAKLTNDLSNDKVQH